MVIKGVSAYQRLDSRGHPTVEVVVETADGLFRALVPSGASTGKHEAVELRDGDKSMYGGKGVLKAVQNVNEVIGPAVVEKGLDAQTQLKEIDLLMRELDGTLNKSRLGTNAILGVSMACARAGAAAARVPLYEFLRREAEQGTGPYIMPVPFLNMFNGGVHSGNTMTFQEIMIAPVGATSCEEAMRMAAEVYHCLKGVIAEQYGGSATGMGDDGGFAPPITLLREAMDLLDKAVASCGYTGKIKYAIDSAASEFFREDGLYDVGLKNDKPHLMSSAEMRHLYSQVMDKYPIVLLEDPFAEDDWDTWTEFNKTCKIELVGDDLLCTNVDRLYIAHERKACNSMLLKVNQIGSVTEAIEAATLAFSFGWSVFVSHRSGETTDDFIADLTVALGAGHLKSGAPCRGERVVKYNRLMDIEAELKAQGKTCVYAGNDFRFAYKKQ